MTDLHVAPLATRQISLRRELESLPAAPGAPPERRRRDDGWLDRWLDTCSDLARLQASNPMLDAVIDEIDGRRIRIGDHWLCDFASCNYLGFDLDAEIMASIGQHVLNWGTHPSWSRLLGSPVIYEQIEHELTALLGAPDTLVLPTITHIHMSVIPVLAGGGNWGSRGNSIVRHFGESYDNVVLVGGFSKAYSSLLAFLALPTRLKNVLKIAAPPYLYSGPSPTASLATVLAGFDVNERRGDDVRRSLFELTARVLRALERLDVATPNRSGFPIVEIPLRDHRRIADVGRFLFDRGVYVTLAAFPLVPKDEVGFRLQVTAANTVAEVDRAIVAVEELAERGELKLRSDDPERFDWAA